MAKVSEGGSRKTHERPNTATDAEAATYVDEMDRIEQDRERRLHDLKVAYQAQCLAVNQKSSSEIKAQLEAAKEVGLTKGTLKLIVTERKAHRKHEEALAKAKERSGDRIDRLESEERDRAVNIIKHLGDDFASFGLGKAAVEAAGSKPAEPDAAGIAKHMAEQEAANSNAAA